jgi:1-acyl-sn-glycerol-3-phosphate acyltransferase
MTTPTRPRHQNRLIHWASRFILWCIGWHFEVGDAHKYPSYVITGAHHTSNWDGILAVLLLGAGDVKASFMIKENWVRPPIIGSIVRWLGGVAIDRSQKHNVVEQLVQIYKADPQMVIGITPEGTRKKTDYWHMGFYHIAQAAHVPMVIAFVDYKRKVIGFGPAIFPTGDVEADLDKFRAFFKNVHPRYPENAGDIRVRPPKDSAES